MVLEVPLSAELKVSIPNPSVRNKTDVRWGLVLALWSVLSIDH